MWGIHRCLFINLPVQLRNTMCRQAINVIFKVDTGSGIKTLTAEVRERLAQITKAKTQDY